MKTLISIVNTGDEVTKCGTTFPQNVPIVIYRNRAFWLDQPDVSSVLELLVDGTFVGYSFDGTPNAANESVVLYNEITNEAMAVAQAETYAADSLWYKRSCEVLTEGFLGELDTFDFDAPDVTLARFQVLQKVQSVLCLMSVGYLHDATEALKLVGADTSDDFLSETRLAQYIALFESAAT